jgi:hypothetical protein
MSEDSKSILADSGGNGRDLDPPSKVGEPYLEDPRIVLSLLEADQVVAAKRQSRFGRRKFSAGVRAMLWGLRIYVILMLIIVLFSVIRALHTAP